MSMPRHLLAAAAAAAALVLFSPPEAAAQGPNARTVLPGFDSPILLDTMAIENPITGAREAIFEAVNKVLAEWKIPIEERESTSGKLEHVRAQVYRRIGGQAMSKFFDCGRGFSGNNADIYRMRLAVAAWVEPLTGVPERLAVAAIATGRDPAGSRTTYVRCNSTGSLEQRIWERVREIVEGQ